MTTDRRRLLFALAVCVAATTAELAGGGLTGSLALTADGVHSLVHVGALGVAVWGAYAASAAGPALRQAVLVNTLIIVALSFALAVESAARLTASAGPAPVAYDPAIAITAFGLLANIATILALGGGAPEDLNHQAALFHMLGDAAVAVLALVGLGAGRLLGWAWGDAAAGLAGAAVLVSIAVRLLRRTLGAGVSPARSGRS